jgi:hypothetical protein
MSTARPVAPIAAAQAHAVIAGRTDYQASRATLPGRARIPKGGARL